MHRNAYAADRVQVAVQGREVQRYVSVAAAQGVRLARLRTTPDGCTLWAAGADLPRLQALAAQGGWQCRVLRRQGPGRTLGRLWRRPGLVCGAVLFLALVHGLPGFVWCIDPGTMPAETQISVRALLADCGIREGTFLTTELLQTAQQKALQRSGNFGWISLNFAEGCLYIESTPAQYQTVRAAQTGSLYAKADGEILAVETDSGFAQVEPGQYVAAGQLLVADTRADRKGNPVRQAASGRVTARIRKEYTAEQPLQQPALTLTGRRAARTTLYLPGYSRTDGDENTFAQYATRTEWQPLALGRAALPGSLLRETAWEQRETTQTFTPETAQALALRACRAQLLRDFPDAEIEAEQRTAAADEAAVRVTVQYTFTADLAEPAQNVGE